MGVAVAGGTTTITSSPGRATPKAVRMAASFPRGVASAARFASSIALRSSSVSYCRLAFCASDTATCALTTSPQILVTSQNPTSKRMPIRIPCRHCLARIPPVYRVGEGTAILEALRRPTGRAGGNFPAGKYSALQNRCARVYSALDCTIFIKTSSGIFTFPLPRSRSFFLPRFCLSRSLFLRETSPP